jgi:nucleotide-binding universal stress UspA family protein
MTTATTTSPSTTADLLPAHRIMVAIEDSETGRLATAAAAKLALRWNCELSLVHVVAPPLCTESEYAEFNTQAEAIATEEGHKFIDNFPVAEMPADRVQRFMREGDAAQQIIEAAKSWNADMLVIGTHSRHGLRRMLLGSVAATVVRHAPCTILCVNRLVDGGIGRHIVAAVDYDEQWPTEIKWASAIVQADEGTIEIVHSLPNADPVRQVYGLDGPNLMMQERKDAFHFMESMTPQVPPTVNIARNLQHGPAANAILCAASSARADLIVIGTTARHGLSRMMLGSTTDAVLRKAECPVLCVKCH